jgi:hypothetical protein
MTVTDFAMGQSVQPRVRVLERVGAILADSGRNRAEIPIGFTHKALAAEVYGTDRPTAAQLSAVRRAVAKLVAAGKAERDADARMWNFGGRRHSRRPESATHTPSSVQPRHTYAGSGMGGTSTGTPLAWSSTAPRPRKTKPRVKHGSTTAGARAYGGTRPR